MKRGPGKHSARRFNDAKGRESRCVFAQCKGSLRNSLVVVGTFPGELLARAGRARLHDCPMFSRVLLPALVLLLPAFVRADDPATFEVGDLTFTRPAEWKWVPVNSPMRKAQLQLPGADGPADLTFFHFGPGGAGGVEANAQRWLKQFSGKPGVEKTETEEIAGTKVTLVSTEGTFNSGMPGGEAKPLENQALLGGIIDRPGGLVFAKMTGPITTVKGARARFTEFLKTALTAAK